MIDGIPIISIGQSGLLTLVFLLVITDRLVWHRRLRVLEQQIEKKDAQIAELTEQQGMLLRSTLPAVNSVFGALHDAVDDRGGVDR